jgi:hypothetical protein
MERVMRTVPAPKQLVERQRFSMQPLIWAALWAQFSHIGSTPVEDKSADLLRAEQENSSVVTLSDRHTGMGHVCRWLH